VPLLLIKPTLYFSHFDAAAGAAAVAQENYGKRKNQLLNFLI